MYKFYKKNKHHIINLVMVVVFVVFFGLGMFLLSQRNDPNTLQTSASETKGTSEMMLVTQDGSVDYNVGDTVAVVVSGQSRGHDINGFDVLLSYDADKAEFVDATAAMSQFQAFAFNHPAYVAITGTKLLTVSAATPFKGEPIMVARFKLKAAGAAHFQINEQYGNEQSKMVDMNANIYGVTAEKTLNVTVH